MSQRTWRGSVLVSGGELQGDRNAGLRAEPRIGLGP